MSSEQPESHDPGLRFETMPYQPDGRCPPLSILLLLLIGCPLAAATGIFSCWAMTPILQAANIIPEWTLFLLAIGLAYLVINVPLMLFVYAVVRVGKIRNPTVVMIAVVIISAVLITSAVVEEILTRFQPGYQALIMEEIVGYAAYGLAAAGAVAIMINTSRKSASQPYCNACGTWKTVRFQRRVNIPVHILLRAVETGDVMPLADFDMRRDGPWTITVTACPNCELNAPVEVKLDQATVTPQGHTTTQTLAHVCYPGQAAIVLEEICQPQERKPRE